MTDWRERKKAATRQSIQDHALRLFVEKGYESTTVEEIAAAAGVSHMTFFRYFPRKEEVVEYDEYDPLLAELVADQPPAESPFGALHAAIRSGLAVILPRDREALLIRTRLILRTPALRARLWIAQDATLDLFATALARRAGLSAPDLATRAQAARHSARSPPPSRPGRTATMTATLSRSSTPPSQPCGPDSSTPRDLRRVWSGRVGRALD